MIGRLVIKIIPWAEKLNNYDLDLNIAHSYLGHCSEATTKATARKLGWNISNDFETCESCAEAKAKTRKMRKITSSPATKKGETLGLDSSYVKHTSKGGKKYWLRLVDFYTKFTWNFFLREKSETADTVTSFLADIEAKHKMKFDKIRCDNAGENTALKKLCFQKNMGIEFEFTPPNTQQYNGC